MNDIQQKLQQGSGGVVKQTKYIKTNPVRRYLIQQFLNSVLALTSAVPTQSLLDVGCGEGFVIRHLRSNRPDLKIVGIDIDAEVLKVAAYQNPDNLLARASAYQLPFPDSVHDMLICNEVLEHLETPENALAEIARISRRYCIFSVPREPHYRLANMAVGANWERWGDDDDHRQRWTRSDFVNLLSRRFTVLAVRTPFPWIMALCQKPDEAQPPRAA